MELYGSPTTKEIKKTHSSGRRGRDGQLGGEDSQQGGGWRTRVGEVAAGGRDSPTFKCG